MIDSCMINAHYKCHEDATFKCDDCDEPMCEDHRVCVGLNDYCAVCAAKRAEAERYEIKRLNAQFVREVVTANVCGGLL